MMEFIATNFNLPTIIVAALVFGALGAIPQDGSTVELETAGLSIRVTEIRSHHVESALVCLGSAEPEAEARQRQDG